MHGCYFRILTSADTRTYTHRDVSSGTEPAHSNEDDDVDCIAEWERGDTATQRHVDEDDGDDNDDEDNENHGNDDAADDGQGSTAHCCCR